MLVLKRASTSRPSGKWNDDDYDVLADGVVVGRHARGRDGGVRKRLAAGVVQLRPTTEVEASSILPP